MSVIMIDNSNWEAEVEKTDRVTVVDFYATWCGPCQMQGPIIEELAEERDDVKFCKLDVDEAREIAAKFGVMSIPTIMIFKNGEITYKEPGLLMKEELLKLI